MKKILGLDLGTNSIGWALVEENGQNSRIIKLGSRIVPMDGSEMSNFKKGLPQTKNATKREKKGARVGNKRFKLRRNKLAYVLNRLGMLPEQFKFSEPFDDPKRLLKVNILPIEEDTKQMSAREFMQLRVKAIHEPVSITDFGIILYKLNQLRGYAGGDDEEQEDIGDILGSEKADGYPKQEDTIQVFKTLEYTKTQDKKKGKYIHEIKVLDIDNQEWKGTTIAEGISVGESVELKQVIRRNTKSGKITSVEFSVPNKTGWRKRMENMENALENYSDELGRKAYLSEYLLNELNENQWKKIRNNVILRARYKEEFDAIWDRQYEYHFNNLPDETIKEIAAFLFPGTKETQQRFRDEALLGGLKHIIRNQIIYYQRELKDQSHLISNCRFEPQEKVVAKSHPLFQEYAVWEQINKLSINKRVQVGTKRNGKPKYQYIERPISSKFKTDLFDNLHQKRELSFSFVFKELIKSGQFVDGEDFFNGMDSKGKLIGNKTKHTLQNSLGKYWKLLKLDTSENFIQLWDILYNGKGNEYEINSERNKLLAAFLSKHGVENDNFEKLIKAISTIKFPRDYASVSLKAVKKALPLVRAGKYFDNGAFSDDVNERIIKLVNENVTNPYDKSVQTYLEANEHIVLDQGGFVNAHALMLLYGQHTKNDISEADLIKDFQDIKPLERNLLKNPLVEQMINETLMVVKDIWRLHGKPDEIKVELARELKNSAKERSKINDANKNAEKENKKIRDRLSELKKEQSAGNIERYKLWASQRNNDPNFLSQYESTKDEVKRMKLWEEQGHVDPYTGKYIPLANLFNKGLYDIDHIIPRSRYFDDSLGNKVVCATSVNSDKGNRTAMEYFDSGSVECELLSKEAFMDNAVNKFFGIKRKYMLATEIPSDPIERQKKETQYISTRIREELAKIVGSNNVKTTSGGVTHYLRNHWGITDVFKSILLDRFYAAFSLKAEKEYTEIMNDNKIEDKEVVLKDILSEKIKGAFNEEEQGKFFQELEFLKGVTDQDIFKEFYLKSTIFTRKNKQIIKGYSKRIDHRHHAMDALVVAATDPKAIKRLNDLNKHLQDWLKENINRFGVDLDAADPNLLDNFLQMEDTIRKKVMADVEKFRNIELPWPSFRKDFHNELQRIIVSHKPKDELLIQNKEEKGKNGNLKQTSEKTIKIRGALHEETIYGLSSDGYEVYRIPLTKFANKQFDTAGNIEKIRNKPLRNIIREHFLEKKSEAFTAEGILHLNKKLKDRKHPPVNSVKVHVKKITGKKPNVTLQKLERKNSYNNKLYVATGSNYLFAVLEKNNERIYDVISLFDAVELIKEQFKNILANNEISKESVFKEHFETKNSDAENKAQLLFTLKKRDMVYLPVDGEEVIKDEDSPLYKDYWQDPERIGGFFTVEKFSGKQIYFLPHTSAEVIEKKTEYGSQDKLEFYCERKIVQHCFPANIDRLGNVCL